jgi:hypothetical protein
MMHGMASDAVEAALAEYMQRVDRGEAVDRARFLKAHPECAADLSAYLAFADEVDDIVSPQEEPEDPADQGPGSGEEDEWLLARSATLSWIARQDGGAGVLLPGDALGPWLLLGVDAKEEGRDWVRFAARRGEEAAALLRLRPSEDPFAKQRFRLEAGLLQRALADVPGAQPILEVGVEGPWRYLCTPPWPQADLSGEMSALRADLPRAAATLAAVAEALARAHDLGILHEDLRPGQIRLGAPGAGGLPPVTVTGFGLARLAIDPEEDRSPPVSWVRNPRYSAPEVVRSPLGRGAAADVYALGVILYEVLAGRLPFEGVTPLDTMMQVLRGRLEPPGGDEALSALCLRALHPDPARRPGAAELAQALRRFQPQADAPRADAPREGWSQRVGRWLKSLSQ